MRQTRSSILMLALALSPALAGAQRDALPAHVHPDSIPVDTTPAYRPPSPRRTLAGTAQSMAFAVVAPFATSAVLLFPGAYRVTAGDTTEADFVRDVVYPWMSVGMGPGVGPKRRADFSGTAAAGLEVLTHGVTVDARWEHVWIPEHLELRTARAGWLAHPRPGLMGGVVVGYRDARGPALLRGVDFGFPFVVAVAGGGWLRAEPSYIVGARRRVVMSYRVEVVPPRAAARPHVPTVVLEARGFDENDGIVSLQAQFGVRTRP